MKIRRKQNGAWINQSPCSGDGYCGTIGTGLFLGAGRSISLTGPSIILIYMITGAFMFLMMRAVGEMLYQDPEQHTLSTLSPVIWEWLGIFLSLVLWLSVVFIGMAEITAISDYVRFWFPPGLAG